MTHGSHSSMFRFRSGQDASIIAVCTIIGLGLGAHTAFADPAAPDPVPLTQPDSMVFVATQFGDEWYNGHEHEGYTILQNATNGYWVYARTTDKDGLELSALRVGIDSPAPAVQRHLRDSEAAAEVPYYTRPSNAPTPPASGRVPAAHSLYCCYW